MPIVEAVGISANSSLGRNKALARAIEKAMSDAVLEANAAGITDPVKVKEAMMAARELVKRELLTGGK